jgi:hypothetical protein
MSAAYLCAEAGISPAVIDNKRLTFRAGSRNFEMIASL